MQNTTPIAVQGGLRTAAEKEEGPRLKAIFESNPTAFEMRMDNFPKYVRRQPITRFLALYEIFKRILTVKGSIVECGVHHGFGFMTWSKLSAILEPVNLTRRIYGFDTFDGFPGLSEADISDASGHVRVGDLAANSHDELVDLIATNDSTRFLGHISKTKLIKGDAVETIPKFIETNPHVLISLLFLDFDLFEPTKVALEHFLPRMPRGAVIAFDELDNPLWPGETIAMLEAHGKRPMRMDRLEFDPYIGFAVLD